MKTKPHLILTVTNDLTYDRRMQRIAAALVYGGFDVTLTGRKLRNSIPFSADAYLAKRIKCFFEKGFLFYAEYNLRLFFWLLGKSFDIVCACDLDTALPVRMAGFLKGKKTVLDAHEFFTEVPEIAHRRGVKRVWEWIGKRTVPGFDLRYTVGDELARIMGEKYRSPFGVVRNIEPVSLNTSGSSNPVTNRKKIILYQGAINVGRGLEVSILAMSQLPEWSLWLAGEGDISEKLKTLVHEKGLDEQVTFKGWIMPSALPELMAQARLGINLREATSQNDYYSLPNKFFDFIHAGLPSINMAYPEYQNIMTDFPCGILIDEVNVDSVVKAIREVEEHPEKWQQMSVACVEAARHFTWEHESEKLIRYYHDLWQEN